MLALKIRNELKPVGTNERFQYQAIPENKNKALRKQCPSMGMAIPFHPVMWDDKTIEAVLKNSIKSLEEMMKDRYTIEVINDLVGRLKKLFTKLNFNTHRKSLSIILTPEGEKIFYLNFPVKPVIFFAKNISALELAANVRQEANFIYLVLNINKADLYEFNEGNLLKVYEESDRPDFSKIVQNVAKVIELLNTEYLKPVFVTGRPNLVELFCNSINPAWLYYPLLYESSPFSRKIIQSLVQEIITHWDYWRSKSIKGRIMLALQANLLISNAESVLQALAKGADGLLLLGKKLKRQLQKPVAGDMILGVAANLNIQIEKFLIRGNQIEITETELLKELGGIALLANVPRHSSVMFKYKSRGALTSGDLF